MLAGGPAAWVVSGRTSGGLAGQAGRLAQWAAARPGLDAVDVGWSLATTRAAFEQRAVVVGGDREELAAGLAAVAAGRPAPGVVSGAVPAGGAGKVVLVFPGQGGQWAGMGLELAGCCPVFAARLAECAAALAPHTGWDLRRVLAGAAGAPPLERADVVQPALWAVLVSLAAAWQAAGVVPDAVLGHSQGEIAAATVAGILTVQDGAKMVALRSRAVRALAGRGGMLSVAEPAAAVRARLAPWDGQLSVAVVNGPAATVVAGQPGVLAELAAACQAAGVRTRTVQMDYAAHCPQVEAIREEILAAAAGIIPGPARVPMISAMTGQWLATPEAGPGYWYDSLRAPVDFERAVRALAACGHQVFIEASPHPVLTAAVTETLEDAAHADGSGADPVPVTVTGTLRRGDGGPARFLASLAEVHVRGAGVDWAAVLGGGRRVELPTYAFEHQRYWPEPVRALAAGDGTGAVAEARFWAAVEGGDVQGLAAALAVDARERLDLVLPALASWRRRERDRSVTGGWRYRVAWVPVPEPGPAALSGTWLVVVPAGLVEDDLAAGLTREMTARGAAVTVAVVGPAELDGEILAGKVSAAPEVRGVVSLLELAWEPLPGHTVAAQGLAGTLLLAQALAGRRGGRAVVGADPRRGRGRDR